VEGPERTAEDAPCPGRTATCRREGRAISSE